MSPLGVDVNKTKLPKTMQIDEHLMGKNQNKSDLF